MKESEKRLEKENQKRFYLANVYEIFYLANAYIRTAGKAYIPTLTPALDENFHSFLHIA